MDSLRLTPHEIRVLDWYGKERRAFARGNHCDPGHGRSADDLANANNDRRGVKGEFSSSVILNLFWRPHIGVLDQLDVGGMIEVRTIDGPTDRLIIKPQDIEKKPHVPFVLMLAADDLFTFLGWVFAYEGKAWPLEDWGDPAHYVPQSALRKIDELRRWIAYQKEV